MSNETNHVKSYWLKRRDHTRSSARPGAIYNRGVSGPKTLEHYLFLFYFIIYIQHPSKDLNCKSKTQPLDAGHVSTARRCYADHGYADDLPDIGLGTNSEFADIAELICTAYVVIPNFMCI